MKIRELKKWHVNFKILFMLFAALYFAATFRNIADLQGVSFVATVIFAFVGQYNLKRIRKIDKNFQM